MSGESRDNVINDLFGKFAGGQGGNAPEYNFAELLRKYGKDNSAVTVDGDEDADEGIYDWKRAYETLRGDFDSYRRRMESSRDAERKNLVKEIIRGFLDIVDYMRYTYKAKDSLGTKTAEDEMVMNRMYSFLRQYNVTPMTGIDGKPFDHNTSEAVLVDRSGMFEADVVTMVLNQGFMIGDEVLRHAQVCVSADPQDSDPSPTEGSGNA